MVAVAGMLAAGSALPVEPRLQFAELHMSGTPKALETPPPTPQQLAPAEQGDRPQPEH